MAYLVLSEDYQNLFDSFRSLNRGQFSVVPPGQVPEPDTVVEADALIVLGNLSDHGRAEQLAGVLNLALPRGATALVAYPVGAAPALETLVENIVPIDFGQFSEPMPILRPSPAFAAYFTVYGRSSTVFDDLDPALEVLGSVNHPEDLDLFHPAAVCLSRGQGSLYLMPFQLAGAIDGFFPALLAAVQAHREGSGQEGVPPFLADLRLPGEAELLHEIAAREDELAARREEAGRLERFRLLIGPYSDQALEALVIEALNIVLEGTGFQAEDREDVGVEDFWIVGPSGDFAIAEAKGIGSNVRNEHVNQVDNHREELGERAADSPGLLVVNTFRNDDRFDRRTESVDSRVVRRARASNVLVLRGFDLFNLLSRKLAGEDAAAPFIAGLSEGGGWLEATPERINVHDGSKR